MARPILPRNAASLARDINNLRTLATAIRNDITLDTGRATESLSSIARCIASLTRLLETMTKESRA